MLRVALRVRRGEAGVVLSRLLELVPSGLEERELDADTVGYVLYGAAEDLPDRSVLEVAAAGALLDISTTEIADDWADRWREFHHPLVLGRRLSVRAPWHPAQETELELVIDPGRAFGTGAHATTRLCLELLLALGGSAARPRRPAAIDLGCGSGVLAIAATKLGVGPVLALDHDPVCVETTVANAAANGVELHAAVCFDLTRERLPYAPLLLANLLAPLLRSLSEGLAGSPVPDRPRRVIVSGLLGREAEPIQARFAQIGYACERVIRRDGWAALLLSRGGPGLDCAPRASTSS